MRNTAWAAGLFEGEGCIYNLNNAGYWELKLQMTDLDVMEAFRDWSGIDNKFYTHTDKRWKNSKPLHLFRVRAQSDVRRLLSLMLPYFGNRRAYKALNALDDLELV